jgi:dihydrofolate reductase
VITIVAAIARGGAIGKGGALPWHYPEDMAHFKALTMGHAVILGRRTWESLPARFKPLPGRTNVVLSKAMRRSNTTGPECVARTLDGAIYWLDEQRTENAYIIGGAEVYAQALPLADALEITEVDVDVEGADAFFPWKCFAPLPPLDDADGYHLGDDGTWREVSRRKGTTPELTFVRWERVR